VTFQIDYEIPSGIIIEKGVCILSFKTQMGQPLFACSTRVFNEYMRLSPHGRVLCHIPCFPLNQGTYYMDVHLKKGIDFNDVLDSVEQAFQFHVEFGDFFGTGRSVDLQTSPGLVSHFWSGEELK
jgi:hypothetical protein